MDPQVQQQLMIWGGAFPAGLSIVLLLIFWSIHTKRAIWQADDQDEGDQPASRRSGPVWLIPILLVVGLIGAVSAQFPSFQWWPNDNSYRLPHTMILVGILGVMEGCIRIPIMLAFWIRAVFFAGVFWLLASGYRESEVVFRDDWSYFGWWAIASLAPAMLATLHNQSSEKTPGWIDAGFWMLVLGGMMPTLFLNGYATGATVLPGLLAVLGPAAAVGLLCKPLTLHRGAITVLFGAVLIMMIGSSVHAELRSLIPAVFLIGAVCSGLLHIEKMSSMRYIIVRLTIAVLMLAGAGVLAYHEHNLAENPASQDGEYDPYADY